MQISLTLDNSTQANLKVQNKLTAGTFSVYQGVLSTDPRSAPVSCAVKLFPKGSFTKSIFMHEQHVISRLSHPNIIKHIPIISHSLDCHLILTELAPYGDFHNIVAMKMLKTEKMILTYFRQLIDALTYLHRRGFAHLDLKLENCLLGRDYMLKIADFGHVQSSRSAPNAKSLGGTTNFRAPEVIDRSCNDPVKVDVYSAGVMLYCMKVGELPFLEPTKEEVTEDYLLFHEDNEMFWGKKEKRREEGFFTEAFKELINGMLAKNAEERWTIEMVRHSRWFNGEAMDYKVLRGEMQRTCEGRFKKLMKSNSI